MHYLNNCKIIVAQEKETGCRARGTEVQKCRSRSAARQLCDLGQGTLALSASKLWTKGASLDETPTQVGDCDPGCF